VLSNWGSAVRMKLDCCIAKLDIVVGIEQDFGVGASQKPIDCVIIERWADRVVHCDYLIRAQLVIYEPISLLMKTFFLSILTFELLPPMHDETLNNQSGEHGRPVFPY